MAWEAGGLNGAPDDSPASLAAEARHQMEVAKRVAERKQKEINEQTASKSPAALANQMNERGLVHGDVFPAFLEDGTMVEVQVQMKPMKRHGNFVRMVEIRRSSEGNFIPLVSEESIQRILDSQIEAQMTPPSP
jgi:hypothetical protein